jgi:glutathione S-transferase
MITIFGGWPTRSQRVLWLLEEMGVAYDFRPVDIRNRAADSEFQALNPAGFLPVLRDGDLTMVESIAIMEYLMERYGPTELAVSADDANFGPYQQFLHLGEAGLASFLNIVVANRFLAPENERDNWGARIAVNMFFNRLSLVSTRLASFAHLAGERFTAADISVTYALELGARLGLRDRYEPVVIDYMDRLSARGNYRRALEKSPPWPAPA